VLQELELVCTAN